MTDIMVSFRTVTLTYDFLQLLLGGHIARAVSSGVVSKDEANLWWTQLAHANAEESYLYEFTAFLVSAVKL